MIPPAIKRIALIAIAIAVVFTWLSSAGVDAQGNAQSWTRILDQTERYLSGPGKTKARTDALRRSLIQIRSEADAARATAHDEARGIQELLDALGPPPGETGPAEAPALNEKRQRFNKDIAAVRSRIADADIAIARAEKLDAHLAGLERQALVERLTQPTPVPILPQTLVIAGGDAAEVAQQFGRAAAEWTAQLGSDGKDVLGAWRPALTALLLLATAVIARMLLRRRAGQVQLEVSPSQLRRLGAALANALAATLVPLVGAGVLYTAGGLGLVGLTGTMADFARIVGLAVLLVGAASAMGRAFLLPGETHHPVIALPPAAAQALNHRFMILAVIVALDLIIAGTTDRWPHSAELYGATVMLAALLEGIAIILLLQDSLWRSEESGGEHADGSERPSPEALARSRRRGMRVRQLGRLIALAGIAAALLGFANLSRFLTVNLLVTLAVIGIMILTRSLIRELVGVAMRSNLFRQRLGVRHRSRTAIKFWSRTALDTLMLAIGLLLILPQWGFPREDLYRWALNLLYGTQVGGVTISVLDIGTAAAAFIAVVMGTKLLQRTLTERVLPETALDPGLRNSITSGIGYVGAIAGALVAVAILGINLTNIALVAGALSVGIGFGLQNIVNNFVSGIILLIERPVKVGDWVAIGDKEGIIKHIHVRATELQTFQRASVIIPNAEFISSPVTNWTYKDTYGRIEVKVGVAYGSPVEQVRDILLDCASKHPMVVADPEPFVLFQDFGASSLDFEVRCFTGNVNWRMRIASDLRFAIEGRFREAGIEIPFPQQVVHFANSPPPPTDG